MIRGLIRYQQTGDMHFITFSCHRRQPFLSSAAARGLLESALEKMRRRYSFVVTGYVVMPEHVHLLVSEPRNELLARAVQALKLSTAVRRNERPFWQPRYFDSNVHDERERSRVLRYIHRNPVKRGLVNRPEDWAWSSYWHYATGGEGVVEIESKWTAFQRGNQLPAGWKMEKRVG